VTEIAVWGRGVDLERFKPSNHSESFRAKLNIGPDTPIVLYVGRLVPEKRPDIVAAVIKRLAAQNVDFQCVIVGAGPSEYLLNKLPNTHCLGWLNGDELTEAYASSDIFLFPSSVETFGNVTLEAAASGLPLVVEAKCSGHLVDHEENGYVCEAGNKDDFFEGTLKLCRDATKRREFSEKSVAKSLLLEQSSVVRQMLDNYQDIRQEFYEQYGGNHYNRDEAYRQEGSFQLGMDPRPVGWYFMEFVLLTAIKIANILIKMASWLEKRNASDPISVETMEENENYDEEAQTALLNGNGNSKVSIEEGEEDAAGPGFLCGMLIAIGDSPLTANIVMFIIGFFLFVSRVISKIRRGCARKLCSKAFESMEQRMDAALTQPHQKRKD
jgi:hypothetical protein